MRLPVENIIKYVEERTGVPYLTMIEKSRKREVIVPRQVAMYMVYKYGNIKKSEVSCLFNMERTSIYNVIKNCENDFDDIFAPVVRSVKDYILRKEGLKTGP